MPSLPGTVITPAFFIISFDLALSPISLITSDEGPIKLILLSSAAFAKSSFSARNP